MNNSTPDGSRDTQSATACLSAIAEAGDQIAAPAPEAEAEEQMADTAAEPDSGPTIERARRGVTRMVVLMAIGLATVGLVLSGASWLLYRAGHTVISHATVRGRMHGIGARIDGQVRSVEVQPNQRVSKGDVLIYLEDQHFQAALREARSDLDAASQRYDAEKL